MGGVASIITALLTQLYRSAGSNARRQNRVVPFGSYCEGFGSSGRIRTSNPSVNSRTACSRLVLQTRDLDARKSNFTGIWGYYSGVLQVLGSSGRIRNQARVPPPGKWVSWTWQVSVSEHSPEQWNWLCCGDVRRWSPIPAFCGEELCVRGS